MAGRSRTMRGCCGCDETAILCDQKTPGVGQLSMAVAAFAYRYTGRTAPSLYIDPTFAAEVTIDIETTHPQLVIPGSSLPTYIQLAWRKPVTAQVWLFGYQAQAGFVDHRYIMRPENIVFTPSELTVSLRNSPLGGGGAYIPVPPNSNYENWINEALAVSNIRAASVISSPAGSRPNWAFDRVPEPSEWWRFDGKYQGVGAPAEGAVSLVDVQNAWLNQQNDDDGALWQAVSFAPQAITLLTSGAGPFDTLIYCSHLQTSQTAFAVWEARCSNIFNNAMEAGFSAVLSGVVINPPPVASYNAGNLHKRQPTINIGANLAGAYEMKMIGTNTGAKKGTGVRDYWNCQISHGTAFGSPAALWQSQNGASANIYIAARWRGRHQRLAAGVGEAIPTLTYQTPAPLTAAQARAGLAGVQEIDWTLNGNAFKAFKVIEPRAAFASALALCTQRTASSPTWAATPASVLIDMSNAQLAIL